MHSQPRRTRLHAGGAAAGLVSLVALAGCGGGGSSNGGSSPTASSAVDPCLVNTWVSTAVSGQINGQQAQISGGTGEKVTIGDDGSIQIDDNNVTPLDISAGGQSAHVKQSGQGSGKLTTSAGNKLQVTLTSNTLTQQAFDSTGATAQGTPQAAPATVTGTYTCTTNQQLQLSTTQSDGASQTVTYQPASSGGSSSGSSSSDTGSGGSSSSSSSDTGGGSSTDTGSSSSST